MRSRTFDSAAAVCLMVLAAGATLSIASQNRLVPLGYEFGVFLLAATLLKLDWVSPALSSPALFLWMLWGFAQLAVGWTVYPWATMEASLNVAALGATMLIARAVIPHEKLLRPLAWFGFAVAVLSACAYFTSPGKILWMMASPYPDVWGPFLSRNNFAQFLELTLPVALFLGLKRGRKRKPAYLMMAAAMLAAGIASASRAGSILLLIETGLILRGRKAALQFLAAAVLFVAILGPRTLLVRFAGSDPLELRREIYRSTASMIAARPWHGFGLGTYRWVYPEYARFDSGARVEHAHNDWLEWASEGGLPYAGLWLGIATVAAVPAIRSVWGLGIVAVFVHALVDYPFARLGISAWVFILLGALTQRSLRET